MPAKYTGAYEAAFAEDLVDEEHRNDLAELETARAQEILTELATRHSPWVFKARIVGDWVVNGATPPRVWSIGAGPTADPAGK
jgi:hypothetical protein